LDIGCKEGSKEQQESKKRNNRCSKDNHYAVASDPARPKSTSKYLFKLHVRVVVRGGCCVARSAVSSYWRRFRWHLQGDVYHSGRVSLCLHIVNSQYIAASLVESVLLHWRRLLLSESSWHCLVVALQ
jgi:hypothetical protein